MPIVVLGVTGCIGAYKACEVLRELQKRDVDVHVVMTESATRFVTPDDLRGALPASRLPRPVRAGRAERHPAHQPRRRRRPPARGPRHRQHRSASSRGGSRTTPCPRSTPPPRPRWLVAPAMNVNMFEHPAVVENLQILRARGVFVIEPGAGLPGLRLAGQGAAGRGGRHRGGRPPAPRPPARSRRRDGTRDRRPHRRGHRPGPLRLQPLVGTHGLPAGRGRARPWRPGHARLRTHGAPRTARGRSSWPCAPPGRWRRPSTSTGERPRRW